MANHRTEYLESLAEAASKLTGLTIEVEPGRSRREYLVMDGGAFVIAGGYQFVRGWFTGVVAGVSMPSDVMPQLEEE